ncbi:hypothetical protein K439DRAFT_1610667 [Ramaria rubella]|nr:hypothetical protein K439DRAFT_1610667 [Ramaria rubella]
MLRSIGHKVALALPVIRPSCIQHRTIFKAFGLPSYSSSSSQQYHERKILPYQQSQLYEVVANVDAYHRFVPYCSASRVLQRTIISGDPENKHLKLQAELKVGFMGFEEKYTSDVECRPYEMVQAVASSNIPLFKSLVTTWRFQPASAMSPHLSADLTATLQNPPSPNSGNGPTLVTFDLEYAFANPLHAHVSAAFFGQVSKMTIKAFEERCLEVYGPGTR